MSIKTADLTQETTTTTGAGPFTLGGAVINAQSFATAFPSGTSQIAYAVRDPINLLTGLRGPTWLIALGTLTVSGGVSSLSVDTVLVSSAGLTAPSFSAGIKDIYATVPASFVTTLNAAVATLQTQVAALQAATVPVNSAVPTISGTAQVGQTLTASAGTWTGAPTSYAYQWKGAGTAISGATASTYTPVTGDIGNALTVSVVATNGTGASSPATSAATSAVIAATVVADTRPRYVVAAANAYTSFASAFAAATPLAGSANGGKAGGPFTVSPGVGLYGWAAVLQSAAAGGVTFTDAFGAGGWSGAGLSGDNTGASPSLSTSSTTYVDTSGTYLLFRQDYANSAFTGSIS